MTHITCPVCSMPCDWHHLLLHMAPVTRNWTHRICWCGKQIANDYGHDIRCHLLTPENVATHYHQHMLGVKP